MTEKINTTALTGSGFEKRGGYITPASILDLPVVPPGPAQGATTPSAPTGATTSSGTGASPAPAAGD